MITKQEVKNIAKLARLGLTEKEIEKHQKEFSKTLDYIDKLKEVDVSRVELDSHTFEGRNVMRGDETSSHLGPFANARVRKDYAQILKELEKAKKKKIAKELLDLAPETKDRYLKVKSIL